MADTLNSPEARAAQNVLDTSTSRRTFNKVATATTVGGWGALRRLFHAFAQESGTQLTPERQQENKTFKDYVNNYLSDFLSSNDELLKLINSPEGLDETKNGVKRLQVIPEGPTARSTDSTQPTPSKFIFYYFNKDGFKGDARQEPWDVKLGLGFSGDDLKNIELSTFLKQTGNLDTHPAPGTLKGRLSYDDFIQMVTDAKNTAPTQINTAFKFAPAPESWTPAVAAGGNSQFYIGNATLGESRLNLPDKSVKYTKDASGVFNMSATLNTQVVR